MEIINYMLASLEQNTTFFITTAVDILLLEYPLYSLLIKYSMFLSSQVKNVNYLKLIFYSFFLKENSVANSIHKR